MNEAGGKIKPSKPAEPIKPADPYAYTKTSIDQVIKTHEDKLKGVLTRLDQVISKNKLQKSFPKFYPAVHQTLKIPGHTNDYMIESCRYTDYYSHLQEGVWDRFKSKAGEIGSKVKSGADKVLNPLMGQVGKMAASLSEVEQVRNSVTAELASILGIQGGVSKKLEKSVRQAAKSYPQVEEFYKKVHGLQQSYEPEKTALLRSKNLIPAEELSDKQWSADDQIKTYEYADKQLKDILGRFQSDIQRFSSTIKDPRHGGLKNWLANYKVNTKANQPLAEAQWNYVNKAEDRRLVVELNKIFNKHMFSIVMILQNIGKKSLGKGVHRMSITDLIQYLKDHKYPNLGYQESQKLYLNLNRVFQQIKSLRDTINPASEKDGEDVEPEKKKQRGWQFYRNFPQSTTTQTGNDRTISVKPSVSNTSSSKPRPKR